jgi:hypothetical protein
MRTDFEPTRPAGFGQRLGAWVPAVFFLAVGLSFISGPASVTAVAIGLMLLMAGHLIVGWRGEAGWLGYPLRPAAAGVTLLIAAVIAVGTVV